MPLAVERKLPLILFAVVIVLTVLGFAFYQYTTSLQDTLDIEKHDGQPRFFAARSLTLRASISSTSTGS